MRLNTFICSPWNILQADLCLFTRVIHTYVWIYHKITFTCVSSFYYKLQNTWIVYVPDKSRIWPPSDITSQHLNCKLQEIPKWVH